MITDASIELTGVKCDLETCMNVLDNIGFIPDDLESFENSEARFLIYRVVVNDVSERMMKAIFRLREVMKQLGM